MSTKAFAGIPATAFEKYRDTLAADGFSASKVGAAIIGAERVESAYSGAKETLDAQYVTWCKYVAMTTRPDGTLPKAGKPSTDYAAALSPFVADVMASGETEHNARKVVHRWIVSGLLAFRFGNKSRRELTRVYGLPSADVRAAFVAGTWPAEDQRKPRPASEKGPKSTEPVSKGEKAEQSAKALTRAGIDAMTIENRTALLAAVVSSLASATLTREQSERIDDILAAFATTQEDAQAA